MQLSYKFIGHTTLKKMLAEAMPGQTIRLTTTNEQGRMYLWAALENVLSGNLHYFKVLATSYAVMPQTGTPMIHSEKARAQEFIEEVEAAAELYIKQRGFKVADGLFAIPEDFTIFHGSLDFAKLDKESGRLYVETDQVFTPREVAEMLGAVGSFARDSYVEFERQGNPFLDDKNQHSFIIIGGDGSREDYGTAQDRSTGKTYTAQEVAELMRIPAAQYDACQQQGQGTQEGDTAKCAICGDPITFDHSEWRHDAGYGVHGHSAEPEGDINELLKAVEDAHREERNQ